MTIVLGSDHAGYDLKKDLVLLIDRLGHKTIDVGTDSVDPVDYPDYAEAVGRALIDRQADRGIVICGSGVGASVAVNKMPGLRAGLCHDTYSAHQGVEHDNINVLVLGARIIGVELAHDIVKTYLNAKFSNDERHVRRLNKLGDMEKRYRSI
jgi:RpiB/LacA/LacB family sugar-phosphate isomerase